MASDAAAGGAAAPKFRGPKPFEHAEALDANFDKEQFTQHLSLKALRVPARYTGEVLKTLNAARVLLELPKIKGVQRLDSDPDNRYMILAQRLTDVAEVVTLGEDAAAVQTAAAAAVASAAPAPAAAAAGAASGAAAEAMNWFLPDAARARLRELGATVVPFPLTIGYEHMSAQAVLRALLPATIRDKDIPSSFEMAGHLAHLNLLVDLMPYRKIIGRVILDKNPQLRTAVAKTGVIDTVFRTFPMEVVAGDDDTIVEVRETGALFRFDYRDVYWNSRLSHEHEHIAKEAIAPKSVVADMFCGVGPFAVPLGMPPRSCTVHANDLNPRSFEALKDNVRRNKVASTVHCYNMDGRDFIREVVAKGVPFTHVLMNLPADALSFLDVFVGLYRRHPAALAGTVTAADGAGAAPPAASSTCATAMPMPLVHCYCFSKTDSFPEAVQDVRRRALHILEQLPRTDASSGAAAASGGAGTAAAAAAEPPAVSEGAALTPLSDAAIEALLADRIPGFGIREVRDVAPKKIMVCVEFPLPLAIALATPAAEAGASAAAAGADGSSGGDDSGDSAAAASGSKRPRTAISDGGAAANEVEAGASTAASDAAAGSAAKKAKIEA